MSFYFYSTQIRVYRIPLPNKRTNKKATGQGITSGWDVMSGYWQWLESKARDKVSKPLVTTSH